MRTRGSRACALALIALFGSAACASLPRPLQGAAQRTAPLEQPSAPADYDVLVAQQLTIEGRHEEALAAWLRAVAKDGDSAYLNREAAAALARHSRFGEALLYAARAVEQDPEDIDARLMLAQLYRMAGELEAVEKTLLRAPGEPFDPDAAFLLAQAYLEAERFEEALKISQWLIQNEREDLRGRIVAAAIHERLGQGTAAEESLRRALQGDPGNLVLHGMLATLVLRRGADDEAAAIYRQMLALAPYHHPALTATAVLQEKNGEHAAAIATRRTIAERYPEDMDNQRQLGLLLLDTGRLEEAGACFERLLAQRPEDSLASFFLGVVRRRAGRDDEALQLFASIPSDNRFHAESRAQSAAIHERRDDVESALAVLEGIPPDEVTREIDLYRATLLAKAGRLDDAIARIDAWLEQFPGDDQLLFTLGVVHAEADRVAESEAYLQRAIAANPDNADALNFLAYTWVERRERLAEAETMLVRATRLEPDNGYILDSLGWAHYMLALESIEAGREREGRALLQQAVRELERASELTGGDPVISEHLGDIYLRLGDPARALQMYEVALGQRPRSGEQPDLQGKYERLRGELGGAAPLP